MRPLIALLQDAAPSPHGPASFADSVVVQSPIKGPFGLFMKWALNLPWGVQLAGMIAGAIAGAIAAWWVWQRREPILAWLRGRSTRWKMGAAAAGMGVFALSAVGGYEANHYFMHDNAFCFSCHPTLNRFDKFARSKHGELGCHSCHRQSMVANVKQVFYWMAERPAEIPEHAKVPTKICSECHVQSPTDTGWKRIVSSAGHRVHLLSDTARRLDVQCVTCHGQEVHQFQPVNKTCGQAGCHKTQDTDIVLGKMAGQSTLHCAGCHDFKVPVGSLVSIDSAKRALSPVSNDCLGCHEMQRAMGEFDPRDDRGHNGQCGACHNPHTQKEPRGAFASCATAGCHDKAEEETPFHRGLSAQALNQCGSCHVAHTWTVKHGGGACVDCHRDVMQGSPKAVPQGSRRTSARADSAPVPRATVGLLEGTAGAPAAVGTRAPLAVRLPLGAARALRLMPEGQWAPVVRYAGEEDRTVETPPPPRARADSIRPRRQPPARAAVATPTRAANRKFSHPTHRDLSCTSCHASDKAHGAVTVRTATECAGCHHAERRAISCEGCHDRTELAKPIPATIPLRLTAAGGAVREKALGFQHAQHAKAACRDCHAKGPLLGVVKDCAGCHTEHHVATANCASCHATTVQQHTRAVHEGCAGSGCHEASTVATLPAARQVCLSCHQEQLTHKRGGECADCHPIRWTPAAAGAPAR